jgi:arylsulfatase A-like enzyme
MEAATAGNYAYDDKLYRYSVIDEADPLGYDKTPGLAELLDGGFHRGQTWLERTSQSIYPDLPVQIVELFDSVRAGDMVIFAEYNWDFEDEHVGGHGNIVDVDMLVPMVMAGPDIVPGSVIETARVVDVAPTIVDMMDHAKLEQYSFDGRSLLNQMTQK